MYQVRSDEITLDKINPLIVGVVHEGLAMGKKI
jgi:hypothetical protein